MLKTILISVSIFILISSSISILIFDFGDWNKLLSHLFLAIFIGLIAAPELDPKKFKTPSLFQLICGLFAGLLFGYGINLNGENLLAAVAIGGFIGFTAKYWLKYLPITSL